MLLLLQPLEINMRNQRYKILNFLLLLGFSFATILTWLSGDEIALAQALADEDEKSSLLTGSMVWQYWTVPPDLGPKLHSYGIKGVLLGGNVFDLNSAQHLQQAGFGNRDFEHLDGLQIHLDYHFRKNFREFLDSGDPAAIAEVLNGLEKTLQDESGFPYPQIAGIELNYEGDDIEDYAKLVNAVQERFGDDYLISISPQPWMINDPHFASVIENVDFLIPMFYDRAFGYDVSRPPEEQGFEVTDPGWIAEQVSLWESLDKPFYAGIPSYGYVQVYDSEGHRTNSWSDALTPEELSSRPYCSLFYSGLNTQTIPPDPTLYSGDNIYVFHCSKTITLHGFHIEAGGYVVFDMVTPVAVKRYKKAAESARGKNLLGVAIFKSQTISTNIWDTVFEDAERHVIPVVAFSRSSLPNKPGESDLQALYTFEEGRGDSVSDVSSVGKPLNLTISDESAISWIRGGLAINSSVMLASSDSAAKIIDPSYESNEITIEAWIKPANTTQSGPARIISLSEDTDSRNLTLGQSADFYQTRLRTTSTSHNGIPALSTSDSSLSTNLTHVVYTRDSQGIATFYTDGVAQKSGTIAGEFSNWNGSYRLVLANETTGNRPWLGEFHLVAIYSRALSEAEIKANFNLGPNRETNSSSNSGESYQVTLSNLGSEQSFLSERAAGVFISLENATFNQDKIEPGDFDEVRYYRDEPEGPIEVTELSSADFVELLEYHLDVGESVISGPIWFDITNSPGKAHYRGWAKSLDDPLNEPNQSNPYYDTLHQQLSTKSYRSPADNNAPNDDYDDYDGTRKETNYQSYTFTLNRPRNFVTLIFEMSWAKTLLFVIGIVGSLLVIWKARPS